MSRDQIYLKLFREAVRRADYKFAAAAYDELSISAKYSAEIFVAEVTNGRTK